MVSPTIVPSASQQNQHLFKRLAPQVWMTCPYSRSLDHSQLYAGLSEAAGAMHFFFVPRVPPDLVKKVQARRGVRPSTLRLLAQPKDHENRNSTEFPTKYVVPKSLEVRHRLSSRVRNHHLIISIWSSKAWVIENWISILLMFQNSC